MKIDDSLKQGITCGLIVMIGRTFFMDAANFQVENFVLNFIHGFLIGFVVTKLNRKFRSKK